jgi:carboxyl-terminal processing protease
MRTHQASTKPPPPAGPSCARLAAGLALALAGCSAPQGSIGALLLLDPTSGALLVREAPGELTGAQAGLREGDEIVAIDGADVRGADRDEIHRRLRGMVGTRVELTVVRAGVVERVVVVRAPYRKKKGEAR